MPESALFFGLYETRGDNGLWVYVLCTLVIGGAAAFASGRAVASGWGKARMAVVYAAGLGLAVRYIQYALFEQPLLLLPAYLIDTAILTAVTFFGYQLYRTGQMVRQYPWMFEKTSPLTWRRKASSGA